MIRAVILAFGVLACSSTIAAGQAVGTPGTANTQTASAGGPSSGSTWLENLHVFAGLDGSKQPQDLGINANMGVRFAANLGVPVWRRANLGAQFGVAVNLSDAAVHVLDQIEGTSRRTQTFLTVGMFQRSAAGFSWSLGYDHLHQQYYDDFDLGQVRGHAGYNVTPSNEVGAWFAKSAKDQAGSMADTAVLLRPVTQVNGYLTHTWPTAARTTFWAGVANGHHNIVWVLPDNSRDDHVLVYGAELQMPLSDRFGVTGAANFLTPTATGTVDAFLGLTFYPGRTAQSRTPPTFAPAMGVANNPTFSVDMSR